MLSLSNSFSRSDSEDFFDKATNFLKKQRSDRNYIKVPTISLEIQLTQLEVYPKTIIDFISIDCEGCDLEVIKTLNLKNYKNVKQK